VAWIIEIITIPNDSVRPIVFFDSQYLKDLT
jgi:hypothetical protein